MIIGSGGREHALGWKLAQSVHVQEVLYAPGNGGTAEGKGRNLLLDGTKKENFPILADIIKAEEVNLTIIGPEVPLAEGIVDYLQEKGIDRVFGPTQAAAQLETDKFFSYDLMNELQLPQAAGVKCYSLEQAMTQIRKSPWENGLVLKARGLTGGKGVVVCYSIAEALEKMAYFGKYGQKILLSERLEGEEFSVFGISDGKEVIPVEMSVQDHKRLYDCDRGPNTGGMGAYAPTSNGDVNTIRYITEHIMSPLVRKMNDDGIEYKGMIYAGMMMTKSGPRVLEFNVRLGDPECQALMMMIDSDLYEIISNAVDENMNDKMIAFKTGAACSVVLASIGYPGDYARYLPISGINGNYSKDVKIFHAGTKKAGGTMVTTEGRVLSVTAYAKGGIATARNRAYEVVEKIHVPGGFHYRTDIAHKAIH